LFYGNFADNEKISMFHANGIAENHSVRDFFGCLLKLTEIKGLLEIIYFFYPNVTSANI
jgi:hypothetical protein